MPFTVHSSIATVETIPKMSFTVQTIDYRYSRVASANVYSTEYQLSLTVETIPKMIFTVQSIDYPYSRVASADVYSTEY